MANQPIVGTKTNNRKLEFKIENCQQFYQNITTIHDDTYFHRGRYIWTIEIEIVYCSSYEYI